MKKYIDYATALNAKQNVLDWINHNLSNYLKNNLEDQSEIEHIIDYLVSDEAPLNLIQMSYDEAKNNTEKWVKKLTRKGEHIKESKDDTKVVLDFKDGFKIVQLIGKKAYEREGFLMHNCVASYYGKDSKIYSLRDKDNMPHMTAEHDKQIKGFGNGNIHPKYVGYVVKFLELTGMTVGDSEMAHLGYINIEKFKKYLHKDTKYFNDKYIPEDEKLIGIDGNEFASFDLWDIKPLIKQQNETELKINFKLATFIPLAFDFLYKSNKKKNKEINVASGYYSTAASSGNSSTAASSGNSSKAASSGDYSTAASSGDYSTAASSGDSSTAASSGDSSTAASSGDYSTAASSGDSSTAASSGYSSTAASSGNSSKAASSGDYSTAASMGNKTYAQAEGQESIACALGVETKAKGKIGTWLVLSEWNNDWKKILAIKSIKVDGVKIKEDIWYTLKNKMFVEVK